MADSPYALRLSQAAYWALCPAFVSANQTSQALIADAEQDNTVREEGTAMHWVAQLHMCRPDEINANPPDVGTVAPNGVTITQELYDAALFYCGVLDEHGGGWNIETQLAAPRIHPTACGGTVDAYKFFEQFGGDGYTWDGVNIRVYDFKGGYVPVEVFPNWQLIGYLAAVLDSSPLCYDIDEFVVEFGSVQPRAYHRKGPVRTHKMTIGDARPYIEALRMAAHVAMGEHAPAIAGSTQCDRCNARASCAAAQAAGARAMEIAGDPDIHDLPPVALDYEMLRLEEAAAMIQARLTGLQAQASRMIRNGVILPHYAMESGNGRLKWTDEAAALAMGDAMGIDLRKPVEVITPTQAAERHKVLKELIEPYAQRARGETKLVRFDNNAAVKAFSHLKVNNV